MTETKKEFKEAIKRLNEQYNPVTSNLFPFNVHLTSYIKEYKYKPKNKPEEKKKMFVIELRKIWSVDLNNPKDKNKLFIKKLLSISFSDKPIIAEIKIEYKDKFKHKLKLKHEGLLWKKSFIQNFFLFFVIVFSVFKSFIN